MSEDATASSESSPATEPVAEVALEPEAAELPSLPGPTLFVIGTWFGGALLWVSSVLLVLDEVRAVTPGGGAVLWVHGAALAWYSAVQVGAASRKARGRQVALRALGILSVGIAMLAAAALFIGMLGPGGARPAYVMLGMLGMAAFFLSQWRARTSLGQRAVGGRRPTLVAAAEAFAVIATVILYTLR